MDRQQFEASQDPVATAVVNQRGCRYARERRSPRLPVHLLAKVGVPLCVSSALQTPAFSEGLSIYVRRLTVILSVIIIDGSHE
jgi:hypothetical protein